MPRANPERPSVLRSGRGNPTPEAEEQGPMTTLVQGLAESIEAAGGRWTSVTIREEEDPPSAAIHFTLQGKRYAGVIQPLDMVDRAQAG